MERCPPKGLTGVVIQGSRSMPTFVGKFLQLIMQEHRIKLIRFDEMEVLPLK
jgi:hypothetical protein